MRYLGKSRNCIQGGTLVILAPKFILNQTGRAIRTCNVVDHYLVQHDVPVDVELIISAFMHGLIVPIIQIGASSSLIYVH